MKKPAHVGILPIQFHGIPAIQLDGPQGASAVVSLQGAQVLSWIPAGGQEWLYLSERADYTGASAIRGGVPVCFPQFSGQGNLPKHGLVRCLPWQVGASHADETAVALTLALSETAQTLAQWPYPFSLALHVRLTAHAIDIELEIQNTGAQAFSFTAALHTYLRVTEIGGITIDGLGGTAFRDAANGNLESTQTEALLKIDGEIDRVYHHAPELIHLREARRTLLIKASGFPETVVWNPGRLKAASLADMPVDDYLHMVCVEAACADKSVVLPPNEIWRGAQRLEHSG